MELGVIIALLFSTILSIVISVMGYFLKKSLDKVDQLEIKSIANEVKVSVLENDHKNKYDNMLDKFDNLTKSIDTLTVKIDILNKELREKE
jgi:hypothetical protein